MDNKAIKQQLTAVFPERKQLQFLSEGETRKDALQWFDLLDIPTRKTENWKYTNVKPVVEKEYSLPAEISVEKEQLEPFLVAGTQALTMVFVNGKYQPQLSTAESTDQLKIIALDRIQDSDKEEFKKYFNRTGIHQQHVFAAYNSAFATNGLFIISHAGYVASQPLHILHLNDSRQQNALIMPRNLVVAERSSELNIIETFHSLSHSGTTFTNSATEFILGENAGVNHTILQTENDSALHVNATKVMQATNSRFNCITLTFSGELVRNDMRVEVNGENCHTGLYGLYLGSKKEHFDNYTHISHNVPNCSSNQLYKGIMDDEASAAFFGMVYVAKDAQQTDAYQSNKVVLLSDKAQSNSKPQLEIYADDVSCSHGSTTGQIENDALFYLRSRGIGTEKAKALLLYAFGGEVIDKIKDETLKDFVNNYVSDYFIK